MALYSTWVHGWNEWGRLGLERNWNRERVRKNERLRERGEGGGGRRRVTRNWSPRKLDRTEKLDGLFGTLTSFGRVRITKIFLSCTLCRGTRVCSLTRLAGVQSRAGSGRRGRGDQWWKHWKNVWRIGSDERSEEVCASRGNRFCFRLSVSSVPLLIRISPVWELGINVVGSREFRISR